jgi:hypothetical protein
MKKLRAFGRSAAGRMLLLVTAAILGVVAGVWARGSRAMVPPIDLTTDATALMRAVADNINTTYAGDYRATADGWYAQNFASDTEGSEMAQGYDFGIYSLAQPNVRIEPAQPVTNSALTSTFVPKSSPENVAGTIDSLLRQHGFYKSSSAHDLSGTTTTVTYMHNDQACTQQTIRPSYQLGLRCTSPEIMRELAKQYAPFVQGYLAAHPALHAKDIAFGPLVVKSQHGGGVITASHSPGYDIAEALVVHGNATELALYYQKGKSPWQYVTEAGDEFGFACADMQKSPATRQAFHDQICYDAATQAQRRLDTNRRALQ